MVKNKGGSWGLREGERASASGEGLPSSGREVGEGSWKSTCFVSEEFSAAPGRGRERGEVGRWEGKKLRKEAREVCELRMTISRGKMRRRYGGGGGSSSGKSSGNSSDSSSFCLSLLPT